MQWKNNHYTDDICPQVEPHKNVCCFDGWKKTIVMHEKRKYLLLADHKGGGLHRPRWSADLSGSFYALLWSVEAAIKRVTLKRYGNQGMPIPNAPCKCPFQVAIPRCPQLLRQATCAGKGTLNGHPLHSSKQCYRCLLFLHLHLLFCILFFSAQ